MTAARPAQLAVLGALALSASTLALLGQGCAQPKSDAVPEAKTSPAESTPMKQIASGKSRTQGDASSDHAVESPMVWAHYVTWPIDAREKFDDPDVFWPRYSDRTLLGEDVGTREGMTAADCRVQIEAAQAYGIQGFAVDVPNPRHYVSSMERVYEAAAGTDFKVALCVDGWDLGKNAVPRVIDSLVRYFEAFGDNPNNVTLDGKPVIFIYKTNVPLSTSREIVDGLRERGYEAYWLMQAQRETAGFWEDEELLDETLAVFDGLYDFGINGYTPAQMRTRLENGRRALERAGGGLLVGGVTPGYAGAHNAYYRPFFGTGTQRDNWQAVIDAGADWVCITTWNDYTESTQFEPAVWGRDVRLVLNEALARQWRGEAPLKADAQAVVAYRQFVRLGDPWTLEVLNLGYDAPAAQCYILLTDLDGNPVEAYPPVTLEAGQIEAQTLLLEEPGVLTPYDFQVWAAVVPAGSKPEGDDWQALYPVSVYAGTMPDMKPQLLRSGQWLGNVNVSLDGDVILATGPQSRMWSGRAELIRDGIIVATKDIPADSARVTFTREEARRTRPENLYSVRFSRSDGGYALSRAFRLDEPAEEEVETVVLWREGDFDETWGGFSEASSTEPMSVPAGRVYGFVLPMDSGSIDRIEDSGPWQVVGLGGGTHWGRADATARPSAREEKLPDGTARKYLSFDGEKARVVMQSRTLPHDVMTVEVVFRPQPQGREAYFFSDAGQAKYLGIDSEGRLFAERAGMRVSTDAQVRTGEWNRAAAVYDGSAVRVYLDGNLVGEQAVAATVRPYNSVVALGCKSREGLGTSNYYKGDLGGLSVTARPLDPEDFYFRQDGE
ncbi:MAG: endo-1,3-alpha-glucanase family glycosylhydrolase [Verrucomicrobiota bacterium JB024]|nr:endo-1,3-alpha-glucanase family glycosylhydrolase [Verrucomicrobiota bacterium JB024]